MKISLAAKDGIKIIANLIEVEKPIGWLILIHMMPATKESWQDFAEKAQDKKYESLAIDLRGHGESGARPEGVLYFTDKEHQKMRAAILLSTGLNYRGIKTEPLVKNLQAGQKVFFVSAKDDRAGGDNAKMNRQLYDSTPANVEKQIKIFETGGHGTDLLKRNPKLENLIFEF